MLHLLLLIHFSFLQIFAVPTSSSDTDIPSSTTIQRNTTTHIFTHGHHTSTVHLTPRPAHHSTFTSKRTFAPQLTSTPVPKTSDASGSGRGSRRHLSHSSVIVICAVLGGIFGVGFLLCLIRFLHNYRKTPPRDRITGVVSRYQLQRELEELERNPFSLRRASLREPAPPYFPRPPPYSSRHSLCVEVPTEVLLSSRSPREGHPTHVL
jgi:hypothetical protein